jgi:hypothetical protein
MKDHSKEVTQNLLTNLLKTNKIILLKEEHHKQMIIISNNQKKLLMNHYLKFLLKFYLVEMQIQVNHV